METYDLFVASYVYFLLGTFDLSSVKHEGARLTLKEMADTHSLFYEGDRWNEMRTRLMKYVRRLRRISREVEDADGREMLTVWLVLTLVLLSVAYIREGQLNETFKILKRARRTALKLGYVEPYTVVLSLLSVVLFRLNGNVKRLTDELHAFVDRTDELHLRALLLEVLSYLSTDASSDLAFGYAVRYALTVRETEGDDMTFYLERVNDVLDTAIMRLLYELRVGKVLNEKVEWAQEANTLFDWMEEVLEGRDINAIVIKLYVKLLHYATLRFNHLKEDPLNLSERLRRTDRKLRGMLEELLLQMGTGEDDEGQYGDILKA